MSAEATAVPAEPDPLLRRLERNSLLACGLMTLLAGLIRPDTPQIALGVLAGGGLAAVSYRGIKGGIDAFLRALGPEARGARGLAWPLVKFFTRYAILGLAAYVVVVRLGVHPVGVALGVSSLVIGAALEAVRPTRERSKPGNPR